MSESLRLRRPIAITFFKTDDVLTPASDLGQGDGSAMPHRKSVGTWFVRLFPVTS